MIWMLFNRYHTNMYLLMYCKNDKLLTCISQNTITHCISKSTFYKQCHKIAFDLYYFFKIKSSHLFLNQIVKLLTML